MQTQLRWNRMDEHYAMELDWSRLQLVKIWVKLNARLILFEIKHWNYIEIKVSVL